MKKKELIELLRKENFPEQTVQAFKKVNREKFIPIEFREYAYEDIALPLDFFGATISQPSTIAFMLSLLELKGEENVLEIGSGSGYVLELLTQLTKGKIYGVEIISDLVEKSRENLEGRENVLIVEGDGSGGLLEYSPFDRILISAAFSDVPRKLMGQLREGGILVVPVKNSIFQIKKMNGKIQSREFKGFLFVPIREN